MSDDRKLENWLDSYIECTQLSEPPEIFHIWTAVSTVASALERKCVIHWGPINFYPNMYIVIVAPSGKARKGTAMSYGKNLISRLGIHMAAESITREALVQELNNAKDSVIDEFTGTPTFHSSLTVCAPELVVFLGYNQQQLMMDLTDWYDCGHGPEGRWTYRTKTQGNDELMGVWLNLIGATTPDLLRSTLSLDAIGGGLTSRIIFVYAPDKKCSIPDPTISPKMKALWEDLYYDLEQIHMLRGQFKPTPEFINLWKEWYITQDSKEIFKEQPLQPYIERRPVHVMKLSMIMSACRKNCTMNLTYGDLNRAIGLLEYTEKNMPKVFAGVGKSKDADVLSKVMTAIGTAPEGRITKTDLMQRFYQDADERVMNAIIDTLKSMKFIRELPKGEDQQIVYQYARKEAY